MANALKKLVSYWVKGQEINPEVKMPALYLMNDLELVLEMQRRHDPKNMMFVHLPDVIEKEGYELDEYTITKKGKNPKTINAVRIGSNTMSCGMNNAYKQRNSEKTDTTSTLASLEEAVQTTSEKRSVNMAKLTETAKRISSSGEPDPAQIMDLIYDIITTQFEFLEHFAREEVQNADGSWENKKENAINIYIDRADRMFKIEDNGRGMTQEVMDKYYFNIQASLNEALKHAAGKFGIGAVAKFGLGYEYIKVDSVPMEGKGGMTVVDPNLSRDEAYRPNERTQRGTTVEIKFSKDSDVDFDRIIEILEHDCRYIETPTCLHVDGKTSVLNNELVPKERKGIVSFNTENIQGHLKECPGEGLVDLLSHRIRLKSIPAKGYEGAVNCSGLDTTFSRDSVTDDPVLKNVLSYIEIQARALRKKGSTDINNLSIETRLNDYNKFVKECLFNKDGTPNTEWIRNNYKALRNSSHRTLFDSDVDVLLGECALMKPIEKLGDVLQKKTRGKVNEGNMSVGLIIGTLIGIAGSGYALHKGIPGAEIMLGAACASGAYVYSIATEHMIRALSRTIKRNVSVNMIRDTYDEIDRDGAAIENIEPPTRSPMLAKASGVACGALTALFLASAGLSHVSDRLPDIDLGLSMPAIEQTYKNPADENRGNGWLYGLVALGAGAAAAGTYISMRKKKRFERYDDTLSEREKGMIESVKEELLHVNPDVDVFFGNNMGRGDLRFYLTKGSIMLNKERADFDPKMIALGYAVEVMKDKGLADMLASEYLKEARK